MAIASLLVALYVAAGTFVYNTIGDPLALALSEAEKLDEVAWDAFEDFDDVATGATAAAASGKAALPDVVLDEEETVVKKSVSKARTRPPKSAAAAIAASAKAKSALEEGATIEAPRPLPSPLMPSPWAIVALFAVVVTHVLYHLVCRWVVPFKAATMFCPSTRVGALRLASDGHAQPSMRAGVWRPSCLCCDVAAGSRFPPLADCAAAHSRCTAPPM